MSLAELGVKVIKMGDYSHRNYVEVEVIKPDIIGKYEKLVDKLFKAFEKNDLEKAGLAKIVQVSSEAIQQFNTYLREVSAPKVQGSKRLYE